MKDATCRSSTRSLQKAKRIYHGPKLGSNLEAGLPILVLWPHFWVQNLAPVLGHKTQAGTIQYGQQVCYCRRKLTAAHIRDTVYIFHHISTLVKKYSSFVLSYAQLLICDQGMLEE